MSSGATLQCLAYIMVAIAVALLHYNLPSRYALPPTLEHRCWITVQAKWGAVAITFPFYYYAAFDVPGVSCLGCIRRRLTRWL